jgi:hypothetical protein
LTTTILNPAVGVAGRTIPVPGATVVITLYDLTRTVAVDWLVPEETTVAFVEYNMPVVSCIVPGAMKIAGVESVTAPTEALAAT